MAEHCLALKLRRASRVLSRAYDDALRELEVTANQLNMLAAIEKIGDARQVDLVKALEMEKSTVSRSVKLMEENGWLEEVSYSEGRGGYKLSRTGKKLLADAAPVWREVQGKAKETAGLASLGVIVRG